MPAYTYQMLKTFILLDFQLARCMKCLIGKLGNSKISVCGGFSCYWKDYEEIVTLGGNFKNYFRIILTVELYS